MADGGVVESAILADVVGPEVLGAGTGAGGFGALNLGGVANPALISPEVLGMNAAGATSLMNPLAFEALGSGLTSLGSMGETMSPYAGAADVANAGGYTEAIPQNIGESAVPKVPEAPSEIPSWIKNMYTNQKTGEFDPLKAGMYGLGGMTAFNLLTGRGNNYLKPYQPKTAASYGLGRTLSSNYQPIRMAGGGIADLNIGPGSVASGGVAPSSLLNQNTNANQGITMADLQNLAGQYGYQLPTQKLADGGVAGLSPNTSYPMADQQQSRYAVPSQMPVGAADVRMAHMAPTPMAAGGSANLGGYSDGGRMLKGPGDGMSDSIPASISGKQPARLADGEFVVPADVVSHLGNGSTDAGAKQLYKMMDKVRTARTGRKAQGKQINPKKYLPK